MKNILIIYGGDVVEHDISVITAIQVMRNIDKNLYNVIPLFINENSFFTMKNGDNIEYYSHFTCNKWKRVYFDYGGIIVKSIYNKFIKIDACLVCCHGGIYEGGGLSGLLDIYNIPYTCCNTLSSAICMDKSISKVLLKNISLNVLDYLTITKNNYEKYGENIILQIIKNFSYPIIVKPNDQGSSIGISIAHNEQDLLGSIELSFAFSNTIIIEKALTNFIEYNCAGLKTSLGTIISNIEKPCIINEYLTFDNKYQLNCKSEFPANISKELEESIKCATKTIFEKFNIKGIARCDFMFDLDSNKLYINEINTVPGSLAFYLFKDKFTFKELLNQMIESCIFDKQNSKTLTKYKSNVLKNFKNSNKLSINK